MLVPAPQINHPMANRVVKGLTVFLWGHAGTWKTSWAAQWPGVVFISVALEGGDDALGVFPELAEQLNASSQIPDCPPCFNTTKPKPFMVTTTKEFSDVIDFICDNYKRLGICTVVIDGLCYLIDLWIDEYFQRDKQAKKAQKMGGEQMDPQAWGFLNMYLRSPRVKLQNRGLNVIWTTLQDDKFKQDPDNQARQVLDISLPMVQGQTKIKLPGSCKLHINAARRKVPAMGEQIGRSRIQPIFWVTPDTHTDLRHKYGHKFPYGKLMDPEFGDYPTFRALWYELHEYIYIGQ
jgi:hypothetical protein